jgi:hypothetical protein
MTSAVTLPQRRLPANRLPANRLPANRLPDWPERLAAVIEAARQQPFRWGRHDCCLFVAACVAAMTGVDAGSIWRHRYGSAIQARDLIVREWGSIAAMVSAHLGGALADPRFARRGDVVLTDRDTLAICTGGRLAGAGDRGLVFLPLGSAHMAWRVG